MKIEEKIEKLERELKELKEQIKTCNPEYWDFKIGERFYYIDIAKVYSSEYANYDFEKDLSLSGNIFRTKKEAEKELELRLATQRLKEAIWVANGGEFIGFNPNIIDLVVSVNNNILQVDYCIDIQSNQNWMYIKDKETAEKVLKENHRDFEIYYGMN